ncbi:MAG: nucleotidyltransferase domain-containing protein, partial [Candidatus Bipolaricaulaceae bacterium]
MRELRERERVERLAQARAFAEAVAQVLGPLSAWVYGSVARGDCHFASDIDVLLVAPELPSHPLRRLELLYQFVTPGIEPKAYTLAEFQGLLAKKDAQLLAMLRVRAVLRDDLGLEPALAQALGPPQNP